MTRTILLTGPVLAFARWRAALETAGWNVLELALVKTVAQPFERRVARPDRIAFTSTSGVRYFGAAGDLNDVPCAVVGEATAEAARRAGFQVDLVASGDAAALAAAIVERGVPGTVLWPRGDLARDFAEHMRRAGADVDAPIVYRTVTSDVSRPPTANVVFFASPSAVRAWRESWPRRQSIAIGTTTAAALEARDWTPTLVLDEPTPAALVRALATR